jgi:hypothetical protein
MLRARNFIHPQNGTSGGALHKLVYIQHPYFINVILFRLYSTAHPYKPYLEHKKQPVTDVDK